MIYTTGKLGCSSKGEFKRGSRKVDMGAASALHRVIGSGSSRRSAGEARIPGRSA